MFALNVLVLCWPASVDIASQVGPLTSLVGSAGRVSPVSRGISVDFEISPSGAVAVSGDELRSGSWKGSSLLKHDSLTFANGKLSGKFAITNHAGTSIQGVRFDFVSASESYKSKTDDGTEEIKTRTQPVEIGSPSYFGDLKEGESSISIAGFVNGIKIKPETVKVTVHAVVSGLTFVKQFARPKSSLKGSGVEVDANGDVVLGEGNHKSLWRFSEDGDFKSELGSLPNEGREVALNPSTGEFLVGIYNSHNMARVAADGTTSVAFNANLTEWPGTARFDSNGRLFLKVGNHISTFTDFKLATASSTKFAGLNFRASDNFDLQGDQDVWIVASNNLVRADANLTKTQIVVKPGTGPFGGLLPTASPAIRCSPHGEIFVAEDGIVGKILPRVSIFDAQGRFVRAFGMAGQSANVKNFLPGQFRTTPKCFAFGKNGQVYVTQYDSTCGLSEYMEF